MIYFIKSNKLTLLTLYYRLSTLNQPTINQPASQLINKSINVEGLLPKSQQSYSVNHNHRQTNKQSKYANKRDCWTCNFNFKFKF